VSVAAAPRHKNPARLAERSRAAWPNPTETCCPDLFGVMYQAAFPLYNTTIPDMEVGCKAFRGDLLRSLMLVSDDSASGLR
jgi:hypothetical protein